MCFEKTLTVDNITVTISTFDYRLNEERAKKALKAMHRIEKQRLRDYAAKGHHIALQSVLASGGMAGSFTYTPDNVGVLSLTVFPVIGIIKGTVVHELTHYDQWARGDLDCVLFQYGDTQYITWMGKKHPLATRSLEYLDQPWEVEAHRNEDRFMAKHGGSWWSEKALTRRRRLMMKLDETVKDGFNKLAAKRHAKMI